MINIENNNTEQDDVESRICEKVYDYYNGALSPNEVRVFERHLIQCPDCERTVLTLDRMLSAINEDDSAADLPQIKSKIPPRRAERKTKP
ncbi:MAG: zf-HC2 domain-containing protein [Acidobacteria bacterium]|nr:zf-HC2 domain-containing protein [Acidobacteriota bacterium]